MTTRVVGALIAVSFGLVLAASADSTPASKSTLKCQKFAQKEAAKLSAATHKVMANCLQKVAIEVVKNNPTSVDVSGAVHTCIAQFYKLGRSDGKSLADKMVSKVSAYCDPNSPDFKGAHVADDVLGGVDAGVEQPLSAASLDAYCGSFAAGASTVEMWIECLQRVAECHARQQIAVEFPRSAEWMAAVFIEFLSSSDPKLADATTPLFAAVQAIDGDPADGQPDISCPPPPAALVPGTDPILPRTGQTTAYNAGSDGDVRAGQARSFTDNGDGTITDGATGLRWEKKEDFDSSLVTCKTELSDPSCANPHDADNVYEWCEDVADSGGCDNAGNLLDGPVMTVFLEQLNNRCNDDVSEDCTTNGDADCTTGSCGFAGYRDWRLPNRFELESLVSLEAVSPATYAAFDSGCSAVCSLTDVDACSCTVSTYYWSSTTYQSIPFLGWLVRFTVGSVPYGYKTNAYSVRAVRGGL